MHASLDGFVANSKSEMNWVKVDKEMFDYAGNQTDEADTALYGRVTWEMMENYWPTAGIKPEASKHDIQHSEWYNNVEKIVVSKTLNDSNLKNTRVIGNNIPDEIRKLKQKKGKNIIIFGSPSVVHSLMAENLIDDYWIFVNPILIGQGIPLFTGIKELIYLKLVSNNAFQSGVVSLHYQKN